MNLYTFLVLSLLITQIFSQCGEPDPCSDQACCACRQNPNVDNGNGFYEFDAACKANGGGEHCVADSGCRLCYKPTFGASNVGNRPICTRFAEINNTCNDDNCCINQQNPNPTDGNGFYEFEATCLPSGGLHGIANSGCRLCYKPVLGGINVGTRPICRRFANLVPLPFTFPPDCSNEQCCIDAQIPNLENGNGFLEFNADCKANGGGLHCVAGSGCRLCYRTSLFGSNIGSRPTCQRFLNLFPICSDNTCCLDAQDPNLNDGTGFLEFNADCKANGGGLHCVADSGCRLCYNPVNLAGINIGERPICERFAVGV
jgi:hypothetical protein